MNIYEEISLFAKRQRDEINKEKKKRKKQVYHILHREYIYPQYGSGRQSGKVETGRVEKVGWKRYTEQGTVAVVPRRE